MKKKQIIETERRRVQRSPCSLPGICVLRDNKVYNIWCNDISVDGIGFSTPVPLSYGSKVFLEVISRNMGKLLFRGEIRWCRKTDDQWQAGLYLAEALSYDPREILSPVPKHFLDLGVIVNLDGIVTRLKKYRQVLRKRFGKTVKKRGER